DAVEAPVRVGASDSVDGHGRKRGSLAPCPTPEAPRRGADRAPRPTPGDVDVVGQGHGETSPAPARRLETEPSPQPLERRVPEARARSREAPVRISLPTLFLQTRQVVEGLRELVAQR